MAHPSKPTMFTIDRFAAFGNIRCCPVEQPFATSAHYWPEILSRWNKSRVGVVRVERIRLRVPVRDFHDLRRAALIESSGHFARPVPRTPEIDRTFNCGEWAEFRDSCSATGLEKVFY